MTEALIVSIHITGEGGEAMRSVAEVVAVPGRGLEGDRYYRKRGTYTTRLGTGRDVTLIEEEALGALTREAGIALNPGDARRNLVTRGVALNELIGKEFRVGEVVLRGVRPCDPCRHLERLTVRGVLKGLVGRGGLRADIVLGGTIRVGDRILTAELAGR